MTTQARWDYGPEGTAYPVQPGEVWQCGPHVFRCASVMDATQMGGVATLVYADPPWNQGNLASFHTKAALPYPGWTWLDVYRQVLKLAAGRPCFLEGGIKEAAEVAGLARETGRVSYARWTITYYRKHPAVLHYFGPWELPAGLDRQLREVPDDDDTPGIVLGAYPRGLVVDPTAGRGLTSRAAAAAGWPSVSIELHPARVSAALARLAKATGDEPHLAAS